MYKGVRLKKDGLFEKRKWRLRKTTSAERADDGERAKDGQAASLILIYFDIAKYQEAFNVSCAKIPWRIFRKLLRPLRSGRVQKW
jgi:hypothetical protein